MKVPRLNSQYVLSQEAVDSYRSRDCGFWSRGTFVLSVVKITRILLSSTNKETQRWFIVKTFFPFE